MWTESNSRIYFSKIILRLASSIVVLFLLVSLIFIIVRIAPGDPTQKLINPQIDQSLRVKIVNDLKLDQPVTAQYFQYLSDVLSFDFGISYSYRVPVVDVLSTPLKFTILFSLISFVLQIFIGGRLAIFAINSKSAKSVSLLDSINIFLYVIPSFVLGLILLLIFPVKLGIFYSSGAASFNYDELSSLQRLGDVFGHLFLPMVVLTVGGIPLFYKYLKESMQAELKKDYVTYLLSIGVEFKSVLKRHILPNAVVPVISIAGITLGLLFNGALITEYIFGLPGMGRLTYYAILSNDYPLVAAASLISGALVIFTTFLADVIKIFINKAHIHGALN